MLRDMSAHRSVIYEALFELSQSISGHNDLDSLCEALFRSLKRVIKFDGLALLLHDAACNALRMHALATTKLIEVDIESTPVSTMDDNPAGWVWTNQKPVVIPRLEQETRWPEFLKTARAPRNSSLLLVPMTAGDRRLGILIFGSFEAIEISRHEMDFALRVASEFAVTVDSYLTQQKYLRERDRLQLLFDVTNSLVSKLSPDALFSAISDQLNRVVACDIAALALLDNKTGELVLSGLHSADPPPIDLGLDLIRARPDGLPCAEALSTGKPVVVDGLDIERFPSPLYRRWADAGLCCGCSIPLVTPNAILGTLELGRKRRQPFTEEDVELLVQVAHQIAIALENSLAYRELAEMKERLALEKSYLENDIRFDQNLGEMLGESPAFQAVLKSAQIVAPTDATVLILGETGTGKELVARAIHEWSGRSKHSFVKVNCAAIPSGLLESELFGHEKGAFTGALTQRIGRFELAHQGTLFLDEIGEIPLELQPKLLRAIQEQEFERLGGNRTIHVDIRLVAASNRDLKAMVDEGKFRSDLYYRLHVFPFHVPPLRERREDIPILTRYFTQKYSKRMGRKIDAISSAAMDALARYDWPGNVRELQNVIERSVVLARGNVLELAMPEINTGNPVGKSRSEIGLAAERERILQALKDAKGVVAGPNGAAMRLGLKRTTLQARMKKLGITRDYQ
jgi:formate hydrogenlyase transcriptional activator